jgi:molybdopterin-containing oxidoreductase family membrane subunit
MKIALRQINGQSLGYKFSLVVLSLIFIAGLCAAYAMEEHGHVITGMNNQIVWGLPHMFAVFLIVSASGALNIASMASVFERKAFKPLAALSALLATALLVGGLAILVLDLGHSDRLLVMLFHFNFKSIFAWNGILYSGFIALSAVYIWTMLEWRAHDWNTRVGVAVFAWRLILTTGTGSIFGFLIGRQALGSAFFAPLFIVYSLAYGSAIFMLLLLAISRFTLRPLEWAMAHRLTRLLSIFTLLSLFMIAIYHGTALYFARQHSLEQFLLIDGGVYPQLFWIGQILLGGIIPLLLLNQRRESHTMLVLACLLICLGGLSQMYVTIIGAQAFPLIIFPGYEVFSSFGDGQIASYQPAMLEWLLGIGGMALSALIVLIGIKILSFIPDKLSAFPTE